MDVLTSKSRSKQQSTLIIVCRIIIQAYWWVQLVDWRFYPGEFLFLCSLTILNAMLNAFSTSKTPPNQQFNVIIMCRILFEREWCVFVVGCCVWSRKIGVHSVGKTNNTTNKGVRRQTGLAQLNLPDNQTIYSCLFTNLLVYLWSISFEDHFAGWLSRRCQLIILQLWKKRVPNKRGPNQDQKRSYTHATSTINSQNIQLVYSLVFATKDSNFRLVGACCGEWPPWLCFFGGTLLSKSRDSLIPLKKQLQRCILGLKSATAGTTFGCIDTIFYRWIKAVLQEWHYLSGTVSRWEQVLLAIHSVGETLLWLYFRDNVAVCSP